MQERERRNGSLGPTRGVRALANRPFCQCAFRARITIHPRGLGELFMVTGLNHVSIAVPDIEAAARELHEKYGLHVGEPMVNTEQGVRLAYVELGAARIELIAPSRPDSPVAKFLERNPRGGIHHFCLGVDDVQETTR